MNSRPRPSRSCLLSPRLRTFSLCWLVCLWANWVRADAAIVNNFSTAVPGFTNVGSAGCLQEFTGGGQAGVVTFVGIKLRVSAGFGGDTIIQGQSYRLASVALRVGGAWREGGVFVPVSTPFESYFLDFTSGGLNLGGGVSAVRIRGDGIDWAYAGGTTSGSGTLGNAKTGGEIATGTVIPGAKFQVIVNRDNSADLLSSVIAFTPPNGNNDPVRLAEGSGANRDFTFTVTRTGSLSGASSVAWAVSGVTLFAPSAAGAADFAGGTLPSGTVNFAASESSKTITVTANGDFDIETAEGFRVALSAPSGATLGTFSEVYGVIENDDGSPVLAIAATDAHKAEGNSGSTPFTFTVTRTGNLGLAVSVNWAVSAVGFPFVFITDFVPQGNPQGTLDFAAQETSKVITINVAGDVEPEPNKEFRVTLSGPTGGATLGTASAIGTILDDDTTLAISARLAAQSEGNSGSKPFKFAVQRNAQATQLINGITTVNWAVTGSATQSGTTPAGTGDFTGNLLTNAVLTFAAGETEKEIEVLVNGNTSSQGNREFTVTLSSPSDAATLLTPTAVGIILDDDTNPAIVDTFASPLFTT